jgi:hypothetical protein
VKWEIPQVVKTPLQSASEILDHAVGGDGDD